MAKVRPWERFGASERQWRDWRWQLRSRVRSGDALGRHLELAADERAGLAAAPARFPVGTTPYYLSLADADDPFCPVRMQIVPRAAEARTGTGELADPLGEEKDTVAPGLVHRYPDRVLFLATDRCAVYCRHCTRRRRVGGRRGSEAGGSSVAAAARYVRAHREVRDVLVSGGDPLVLSTARLEEVLTAFRRIPHVEILRVGTRLPVVNPFRVDRPLVRLLKRLQPLYVVTHFNHPKELTPEARRACAALADAGVPVENQAVLLRRVNSSARILADLFRGLLAARVRPYYLHQLDVAEGLEHLRTPLEAGIELIGRLRGAVSGLAVPHLAVDLPGGGGKVTLQEPYLASLDAEAATLRSFKGVTCRYPQPKERDCTCPYEEKYYRQQAGRPPPR